MAAKFEGRRFVHFLLLLNANITHFTAVFYQTYCENLETFRKIKRVVQWAPIYLLAELSTYHFGVFYLYMGVCVCVCVCVFPFLLNHLK